MRKLWMALCGAFCSAVAFAEGEGAQLTHILPQTDETNGIQAFSVLQTDLAAWSGKFLPIILGVLGIFLVYWLIKFGLRLFKSFASSGR